MLRSLTYRHWTVRRGLLLAALVAGCMAPLLARELRQPIDLINPVNPAAGSDKNVGVYVRESAEAADKFASGQNMERQKEWDNAASFYQEVMEKHGDKVVPSAVDDKNNIVQYMSITESVRQRLCRWPEEGLQVYRNRYEAAAMALLDQARPGDDLPLRNVLRLYFVTESGKKAGMRLVDLCLEAGDFADAGQLADRLLQWHPTVASERPRLLFRAALAYHLAGDAATARARSEELKAKSPDAIGRVAGRDVVLHEELGRLFQFKPPVSVVSGADSWPMLFGDTARSLVPGVTGLPGARLYSVALDAGKVDPKGPKAAYEAAIAGGLMTTIYPVVDRGQLFFQDGRSVWGLQLESGMPLPGWVQTNGAQGGAFRLPRAAAAPVVPGMVDPNTGRPIHIARPHALSLTENSVLAIMGTPTLRMPYYGGPRPPTSDGTMLVCLDRESGRRRWAVTPGDSPDDRQNVKSLEFNGAPLVVGDNVYVAARGGSAMAGEAVYVNCYELSSGKFRWSSYIASTPATTMYYYGGMPNDTVQHLSYASGRIYCLTNIGAVASLDAYSGAMAWLNVYPRDVVMNDPNAGAMFIQRQQQRNSADKPWEYNAPMVVEGRVFSLPSDGKFFLVYDAVTGRELRRIDLKDIGGAEMLLAASGDHAVVASESQLTCFNWDKWDAKQKHVGNPGYWRHEFSPIQGRGFVTSDSIYIPTKVAMYMFHPRNGKVTRRFPDSERDWTANPEEGPGNIIVTEDHVIVATARAINVYTDLERIEKKYLAAIAADPANPELPILHAERMVNAGQLSKARVELDKAITLLGGMAAMRAGPARDRIFGDCITFAQKLLRETRSAENLAFVNDFFDRAAAAANTPSQQVSYRLTRARFLEGQAGRASLTRAVELYQQILSDQGMRIITLAADDGSGSQQAGKTAESAIAAMIRREGPEIYEAFEKAAEARLAAMRTAADPAQLQALAETYPNSKVAMDAMLLAASSFERVGDPRMATQVLRRLYRNYAHRHAEADRGRLFEAMARTYLRVGNNDAALLRMQKCANVMPEAKLSAPLVLSDGQPLKTAAGAEPQTVQEAAAALAGLGRQFAAHALPDLRLPLKPEPGTRPGDPFDKTRLVTIDSIRSIALPPRELPDAGRNDRVVGWTGQHLQCFVPGKAQALWSSNEVNQPPLGVVWIGQRALIWAGPELALLDGDTGKAVWKSDLKAMQSVELVAGGEEVRVATSPPGAEEASAVAMRRRLVMGGVVLEQPAAAPEPVPPVAAPSGEYILHVRPLSDRVVIATSTGRAAALKLNSGAVIWQTRLASQTIHHFVASDDFVVARIVEPTATQIVALDSFNGQQLLRQSHATQQGRAPINIALAPDGMLIMTTNQQVMGKDLFEPGDAPNWSVSNPGHNYIGMSNPGQLLIHNGNEILAVCDSGMFVDRRNVRDGSPAGAAPGAKQPNLLSTRASSDPALWMRVNGSSLYLMGSRSVVWYSLDYKADETPLSWTGAGRIDLSEFTILPLDAMLGRDYLLLPGTFTAEGGGKRFGLHAFSLAPVKAGGRLSQSGLLVYGRDHTEINEPSGIRQWQPVDGGVCYVNGDGRLVMLRGARP